MEEGKITVDGVTRQVPKPFTVIATQNPFGSSGTQRLPQSQMDRFLVRLSMGYPDRESEILILKGKGISSIDSVNGVLSSDTLSRMQSDCANIFVKDVLYGFITDIANATRQSELFDMGISPRGSIAILKLAKANAFIDDRDHIVPEDIIDVIKYAAPHRTELSDKARAMKYTEEDALSEIMKDMKIPKIK